MTGEFNELVFEGIINDVVLKIDEDRQAYSNFH